jgi:hypothetical protein
MYMSTQVPKEHFDNPAEEIACPVSAVRTPEGKIEVQPGSKVFDTMKDYLEYLTTLYAKGSMCIPPMVTSQKKMPTPGILGGLGTNTEGPNSVERQGKTRTVLDYEPEEKEAYAKSPIDKLDDYEYTRVFEKENSSRNATSTLSSNERINAHKLDWANLPFNSEDRSKQENEFVSGRMEDGFRDPETGVFFSNVDGKNVVPPDMDSVKEREQKVLSSYQPTDITTHVLDNESKTVAQIVNSAYKNDPDWEPVVSKVGDYQWEVTELRPKPRKERYQDEKTKDLALAQERGETLPPPSISIDDRMRDDPYFDKSGVGDKDNQKYWKYEDFNKWTPGLERMFAPTLPTKEWK